MRIAIIIKRIREKELTNFSKIKSCLVFVEFRRESKITFKNHMCKSSESPPAHEESIKVRYLAQSPWYKKQYLNETASLPFLNN